MNDPLKPPAIIESAFILAAGKGTRLRPYTDERPKPMVEVAGRPLIDYILDKLVIEGVKNVTINLSYLGDRIQNHLKDRHDININFSIENKLLETGGGVKNALHTMGGKPFFLINGDAFWDEGITQSALHNLAVNWDADKMDILLLLQDVQKMTLTHGVGDYDIIDTAPLKKCERSLNQKGAYMFAGVRVVNPSIFDNTPEGAFSFLTLMDQAQEQLRLFGVVHEGQWHHISTPEDLESVNAHYPAQEEA